MEQLTLWAESALLEVVSEWIEALIAEENR
jgi:hypothetical protein